MREQIEQLLKNLQHDESVLDDANPLDLFKAGEQESLRYVIDRLRAILRDSEPLSAEKGSESSVGEG